MAKAATKLKLKRKNRGGLANLAGNTYESHFAVWRVLLAVEQLHGRVLSRLALQLRGCHVGAPVMLQGAEDQLRAEFSDSISRRFEFVTFAMDSVRQGATVEPGIGGQVEERLGLGGKRCSPDLVKEWRTSLDATAHAPA